MEWGYCVAEWLGMKRRVRAHFRILVGWIEFLSKKRAVIPFIAISTGKRSGSFFSLF